MGVSAARPAVMSRLTRTGAVLLTAVVVLAVATPSVLASGTVDIAVTEDDTTYTVEVTHNDTAVENASVVVEPTDPANTSYAGDSGTTGPNGTVTFDLPENETEVNITATFENHSATETFVLSAANDSEELVWDGEGPFGQWVISWLHNLLPPDNDRILGLTVAEIVVANNPGADHRSEEADPLGNATGPPEHAQNASAGGNATGPPDHAQNGSSSGNGGNSSDNGNGGNASNNGNGGSSSNNGQGNQQLARADAL